MYTGGLEQYLDETIGQTKHIPEIPFSGGFKSDNEAVDWALVWLQEEGSNLSESYVNLIPTAQGGTHVNGLRTGLANAIREFCEFRSLLQEGLLLHQRMFGIT